MTNIVEAPPEWVAGIYQLETNDPVMGGADGIDNLQARQLAKRTAYLKQQVEAAQGGLAAHEAAADPHPVYLTSAEGDAKVAVAVAALVASSPAALDTLNELATALGNDANFAATITAALAGKAPWATLDPITQAAGLVVDHANNAQLLAALQAIFLAKSGGDLTGAITQKFAGLYWQGTPVGGAFVRKYADVVAATVGGIEDGTVYNVAVNPATGVWAARDVADICWLEKWSDAGVKEFWYAPTAAAGAVPAWSKIFSIDLVNNTITGPTPAQFDSSTKLATTACAMGIGLRSPVAGSGITGAIPASAGGSVWLIASATPTTQTLPAANSVPVGTRIDFWNAYTGVATIARAGADNIQYTQNYLTSLNLGTNDTLSLVSNGNAVWYMVGGSALLRYSTDFGSSLAAGIGYQKLPSGLVIQWGGSGSIAAGGSLAITFPLAFPTACDRVIGSAATNANIICACPTFTTTGATLWNMGTGAGGIMWLAIGR